VVVGDGAAPDAPASDALEAAVDSGAAAEVGVGAPDGDAIDAPDPPDDAGDPADASDAADGSICAACDAYGDPMQAGTVPSVLPELSGLASSRIHPGVLYAHNDSGSPAHFFAMNESAALLGEFALVAGAATDWEDIATGPCDAGSCVYIGDIGDNDARRTSYTVYRLPEPDLPPDATSGPVPVATYEALSFVYPDGPHNAETLVVDPKGDVFVVTKVTGYSSAVYRLPRAATPTARTTLERIGDVSLPASAGLVTGGDMHPCGTRLLLRTYFGLYEFRLAADQPFSSIFAQPPNAVPVAALADEVKGEAVAYASDGLSYFTASEWSGLPSTSLHRSGCR
jgi:hypothetical protein